MDKIEYALKQLQIDSGQIKKTNSVKTKARHTIIFDSKKYFLTLTKTFKPDLLTFGVENRCKDGFYVLFMDYDGIYLNRVLEDLDLLLKYYPVDLTNFYIATTGEERDTNGLLKGNYHAVSFSKHFLTDIEQMLSVTRGDIDFSQSIASSSHKSHVLRITEKFYINSGKKYKDKPKFKMVYPKLQVNRKNLVSEAHYRFFKAKWNFKDGFKPKFDGLTKIYFNKYRTLSKYATL